MNKRKNKTKDSDQNNERNTHNEHKETENNHKDTRNNYKETQTWLQKWANITTGKTF